MGFRNTFASAAVAVALATGGIASAVPATADVSGATTTRGDLAASSTATLERPLDQEFGQLGALYNYYPYWWLCNDWGRYGYTQRWWSSWQCYSEGSRGWGLYVNYN